jgi:single-strand DNA-binding protein
MNDVSLIGRLTRDPELHSTQSGTQIAGLRLALERRGDGAVFVSVKCFDGQARACAEHLAKGRQVAVSGRLELDEWLADDGSKRSQLYVVARSVQFLGGKQNDRQPAGVAGNAGEQPEG